MYSSGFKFLLLHWLQTCNLLQVPDAKPQISDFEKLQKRPYIDLADSETEVDTVNSQTLTKGSVAWSMFSCSWNKLQRSSKTGRVVL